MRFGLTRNRNDVATLTQLSVEGVEQIDTCYTAYLPSFFRVMITPIILFIICVIFRWQVGVVLIVCLPLIPVSIVIVSRFAKRISTNIGIVI